MIFEKGVTFLCVTIYYFRDDKMCAKQLGHNLDVHQKRQLRHQLTNTNRLYSDKVISCE